MKRDYIAPDMNVQLMHSADCICIAVGSINSEKVKYGGGAGGGALDPW